MVAETGRTVSLADAAANLGLAEEDALRAHWYGLLGSIMRAAPDRARLDRLAGLVGDETDFGQGVSALAEAAKVALAADPKTLEQEHFDLFIGVGEHLDRFRSPLSPKIGFPGRGYLIEREGTRQVGSDGSSGDAR